MATKVYKRGYHVIVESSLKPYNKYSQARFCSFGFDGDTCWIKDIADTEEYIYNDLCINMLNSSGNIVGDKDNVIEYLVSFIGDPSSDSSTDIDYYLTDSYPQAAASYSLRRLTGSYDGFCGLLERSSDDETAKVYLYEDPSKLIDLESQIEGGGTLGDWVGGNDAKIKVWYDQSGNNNNLIQTNSAAAPIFISGGVISTKGVLFDGVIDSMEATNSSSLQIIGDMSAYVVLNADSFPASNNSIFIKRIGDTDREYEFRIQSGETRYLDDNNSQALISTNTIGTDYLQSFDRASNATINIYKNGASSGEIVITGVNTTSAANLIVGGRPSQYFDGGIKELILWSDNLSENRSDIEANINDVYSIY